MLTWRATYSIVSAEKWMTCIHKTKLQLLMLLLFLLSEKQGRWSHPYIVTHLYQTEIKCVLVCCSLFDILLLDSQNCSLSAQFLNTSKDFAVFVKCLKNMCPYVHRPTQQTCHHTLYIKG